MNRDSSQPREIDLAELWDAIWSSKVLVTIVTVCSVSVGVGYSLLATEWFRSEVVMVSADRKSAPASLGQLGGLASLAGINIGAGSGSPEPLAVLKSKEFAEEFIVEKGLTGVLLADEVAAGETPDIREAVKVFDEEVRSVTEDKKSGTVVLSIQWKDPSVAAAWANAYVVRLNERLRLQSLQEAQRNVTFLQREIAATDVVQLRQSLGSVLESEMQKLLLARGSESFAFKVVDRATPPLRRSKPNRPVVVLIALFLGVFSSLTYIFARRVFSSTAYETK
jgi:uncharacterized protein involved in exopolysaccharide biosynthesis